MGERERERGRPPLARFPVLKRERFTMASGRTIVAAGVLRASSLSETKIDLPLPVIMLPPS